MKKITDLLNRISQLETRQLLWTNPNPSNSFAGQKVEIDLTNYDLIEIEVKNLASSNYMIADAYRIKKGEAAIILASAATNRERDVTAIDNTGITFSGGIIYNSYGGSQSTDNNRLIPVRIYGIKTIGGGYYAVVSMLSAISSFVRRWSHEQEDYKSAFETDKHTDCFGNHRVSCFVHNRNGQHLDETRELHDTEKRVVSVQGAVHQFCRHWTRVFEHVCDFGHVCNDNRKRVCRWNRRDVVDGCRDIRTLDEVFISEQVKQCKDLRRPRSIALERGCC